MREVTLAKVDAKGNHIPDDSTPTIEELRRDLANGTRVMTIEQDHFNEVFVGEDPNGDIDGDLIRSILAEAAPTNIHAQVALEWWELRNQAEKGLEVMINCTEDGIACPAEIKAVVEKAYSTAPRRMRRRNKIDPVKATVAFNLIQHSVDFSADDYKSKISSLMQYAFGDLDWDELEADLEGRKCVRGEWTKSRITESRSDKQTRH